MVKKLGFALLACVAWGTAEAGTATAKALVDGCRAYNKIQEGTAQEKYGDDVPTFGRKSLGMGYCMGYLNGFLSGYSTGSYGTPKKMFCLPPSVTIDQLSRVMIKRLDDHPEHENMEPLPFVLGVLSGTWPCE